LCILAAQSMPCTRILRSCLRKNLKRKENNPQVVHVRVSVCGFVCRQCLSVGSDHAAVEPQVGVARLTYLDVGGDDVLFQGLQSQKLRLLLTRHSPIGSADVRRCVWTK
jgi:hypothetical protein